MSDACGVRKMKRTNTEQRTKWWKLKKEECHVAFREELRQALGAQGVLPDDWMTTANTIRETSKRVVWCDIWEESRQGDLVVE